MLRRRPEQRRGPWAFSLRVLEPGTVLAPVVEIGPAVLDEESSPTSPVVRTDVASPAPGGADVTAELIAPGGFVVASGRAPRGGSATRSAPPAGRTGLTRCASPRSTAAGKTLDNPPALVQGRCPG